MFAELAKNDSPIKPEITYDKENQTDFFNGLNIQNNKRELIKIVLKMAKVILPMLNTQKRKKKKKV